jgi:hypothetical protein
MTGLQRSNGLAWGAVTVTACTAVVFAECFYDGRWFLCFPIAALYIWGFLAFFELDRENERRASLLRQHGIDERQWPKQQWPI